MVRPVSLIVVAENPYKEGNVGGKAAEKPFQQCPSLPVVGGDMEMDEVQNPLIGADGRRRLLPCFRRRTNDFHYGLN